MATYDLKHAVVTRKEQEQAEGAMARMIATIAGHEREAKALRETLLHEAEGNRLSLPSGLLAIVEIGGEGGPTVCLAYDGKSFGMSFEDACALAGWIRKHIGIHQ